MVKHNKTFLVSAIVLGFSTMGLTACSEGIKTEAKYPSGLERGATSEDIYGEKQSVFGGDGLRFGGKKDKAEDSGIGVNSFLWRATLDTISFMPLASADPFGGVILTDWHTDVDTPNERVKVNAFIMGRALKADGVRVRTFRQAHKRGVWRDAPVAEETARKLEDAILTRARQLRIEHLAQK